MKQQIWSETYKIASYLVNLRGRIGLYAILNLIQDVGWLHAIQAEVKLPKNLAWVFTRQKIVMESWPNWNETITIKTWLRPPLSDAFLLRDYEIFCGDKKIGECTSTFTVIDMTTRKLSPMDWSPYNWLWNKDHELELLPPKIPSIADSRTMAEFEVRNSDIDMNNHVNNTKYAQWILDALPLDTLKSNTQLNSYEVNFLAETKIGDVVQIQSAPPREEPGADSVISFQGVRKSDSKVVFTARMSISVQKLQI